MDFTTARRWELAVGPKVADKIHSSDVASRMLSDICTAMRRTLEFAISSKFAQPREILANYPLVLDKCDSLTFDEPPQALAYLSLHLPDRYCRVFQVLETLLVCGMLPLGRSTNFAAVDVGAGPGPGIFAVRNFHILIEQGWHPHQPAAGTLRPPHLYAAELAASATPFGASHEDFDILDLRSEHNRARHQLTYQLEHELDTNLQRARQLAYEESI